MYSNSTDKKGWLQTSSGCMNMLFFPEITNICNIAENGQNWCRETVQFNRSYTFLALETNPQHSTNEFIHSAQILIALSREINTIPR